MPSTNWSQPSKPSTAFFPPGTVTGDEWTYDQAGLTYDNAGYYYDGAIRVADNYSTNWSKPSKPSTNWS